MTNPKPAKRTNNPVALRFTKSFLRALMRINRQPPSRSVLSSPSQRCRRVRIAADASMALAVGPRRAWSRAVLNKIRTHDLAGNRTTQSCNGRDKIVDIKKKKTVRVWLDGKQKKKKKNRVRLIMSNTDTNTNTNTTKLQKLVPGGEEMDVYSLLDETAHYIKCLTTQVELMKTIATLFSSSTSS